MQTKKADMQINKITTAANNYTRKRVTLQMVMETLNGTAPLFVIKLITNSSLIQKLNRSKIVCFLSLLANGKAVTLEGCPFQTCFGCPRQIKILVTQEN